MSDLDDWKARNDVMLIALNADNRIVAAGWHNLDHEPNKDEKRDLKEFYRDCVGLNIKALRGDSAKEFKSYKWIGDPDEGETKQGE